MPIGIPELAAKRQASEADVDVVDERVNSEVKLATGEESVLPSRLPIIRPESVKIIGSSEALSSCVEGSLQGSRR